MECTRALLKTTLRPLTPKPLCAREHQPVIHTHTHTRTHVSHCWRQEKSQRETMYTIYFFFYHLGTQVEHGKKGKINITKENGHLRGGGGGKRQRVHLNSAPFTPQTPGLSLCTLLHYAWTIGTPSPSGSTTISATLLPRQQYMTHK